MTAQQEGCVPAAIEQNHCLLCSFETRAHCLKNAASENNLLAFGRIFFSHVHNFDLGQGAVLDPRHESHIIVFAGLGIMERLHRRRRRSENNGGAGKLRAHDRRITRVVAWNLFLFVTRLVLFIDDDEAEVG